VKKKVLVTGAAGFLGRHLVRELCERGNTVVGTYFGKPPEFSNKNFRFSPLNILKPRDVTALIRRVCPDRIFHLAAQTVPRLSWKNIAGTFELNVRGTLNILEAIRRYVPKARLFFASTIQVYGRTFRDKKAAAEEDLLWPESPYAASKVLGEFAVVDYTRRFGLNTVIARFANTLGRGQSGDLVFPDWCRQVAEIEAGIKSPVLEVGNLKVWRDFLHVRDTVDAILRIMNQGLRGNVYNVASGRAQLLETYVRFLAGRARRPVRIEPRSKRFRLSDPRRICANAGKLKELGWRAKYSVTAAIEDIFQEQREKVKVARRTSPVASDKRSNSRI